MAESVKAAIKTADAAARQAEYMRGTRGIMQEQAIASKAAAEAAQVSATAAKKATDVAEQALIASDRPWIAVRISIPKGKALVFESDEITAKVEVTAHNVGKSPATNIQCRVELYPTIIEAEERKNHIDFINMPSVSQSFGRVLFLGEQFVEEHTATTPISEFKQRIVEFAAQMENNGDDDWPFPNQGRPAVLSTIWYRHPSDRRIKFTVILGEIVNRSEYGFDGTEGEFSDIEIVESFVSGRVT